MGLSTITSGIKAQLPVISLFFFAYLSSFVPFEPVCFASVSDSYSYPSCRLCHPCVHPFLLSIIVYRKGQYVVSYNFVPSLLCIHTKIMFHMHNYNIAGENAPRFHQCSNFLLGACVGELFHVMLR